VLENRAKVAAPEARAHNAGREPPKKGLVGSPSRVMITWFAEQGRQQPWVPRILPPQEYTSSSSFAEGHEIRELGWVGYLQPLDVVLHMHHASRVSSRCELLDVANIVRIAQASLSRLTRHFSRGGS
jgi:hypothetical protein